MSDDCRTRVERRATTSAGDVSVLQYDGIELAAGRSRSHDRSADIDERRRALPQAADRAAANHSRPVRISWRDRSPGDSVHGSAIQTGTRRRAYGIQAQTRSDAREESL